jgi:hypothetical protein
LYQKKNLFSTFNKIHYWKISFDKILYYFSMDEKIPRNLREEQFPNKGLGEALCPWA